MNVALTRAKSSLFILGNAPTLERSDPTWKDIICDARSRSALFDVRMFLPMIINLSDFTQTDPTYFTRPTTNQPPPLVSPVKEVKVVPSVPVPSDLVAPRDFKPNIGRNPESKPLQAISDHQSSVSAPPVSGVGVKRPVESDDHPPRPPPPRPEEGATKPRVPLVKRPKQPPNIFIPKKVRR
jgi:senataxin